jgi:hypothetical protein
MPKSTKDFCPKPLKEPTINKKETMGNVLRKKKERRRFDTKTVS